MATEHRPTHGWTRSGRAVHANTIDHLPKNNLYKRLGSKFAVLVTVAVGSVTCTLVFAILAIAGLPTALKPGNIGLLFWFSSDFLQLTLLSVILLGQNVQSQAADARAEKTFEDIEKVLTMLDPTDYPPKPPTTTAGE